MAWRWEDWALLAAMGEWQLVALEWEDSGPPPVVLGETSVVACKINNTKQNYIQSSHM